jgi:hypothetical protein
VIVRLRGTKEPGQPGALTALLLAFFNTTAATRFALEFGPGKYFHTGR